MDRLSINSTDYVLQRWPSTQRHALRAWDAADEYLIKHLAEQPLASPKTLLVNDQFGAIAVSMHKLEPVCWSDSWISHAATRHNFTCNQLAHTFKLLPGTDRPGQKFDLVIIKIPKTKALLEYQLKIISEIIHAGTIVIGAAMTRHIHTSTLMLFENLLGPTRTSLAMKKARLIFCKPGNPIQSNTAITEPISHFQADFKLTLVDYANVFSRGKLDIGSRFMLEQFHLLPPANHIIDLACGNGVLGIMAKRQLPNSSIDFVDESYMAIASARINYKAEHPNQLANFHVNDCLGGLNFKDVELVLCNPPFHQQHSVGNEVARRMFSESRKALARGGQLWVVANRHMNYHHTLKKLFGNIRVVASNRKFCVFSCTR